MLKGGYKIVDLKDKSLSSESVTIGGVYEAIENSYRKAIMLANIVIDSVEKNDLFVEVNVDSTNFVIKAYGGTITITSADAVTFVTE